MIVVCQGDRLVVTTQPDHAILSAELLALWRADGLPDHPRRQEILFAAREHDNGWREVDAAPRVDPATGRPHTFQTIPADLRHEIWLRGVRRFQKDHPYASLLVAEHAAQLLQTHRPGSAWQSFSQELNELRQTCVETCGVSLAEVSEDYRFLELADLLSLAVCSDWSDPFEHSGLSFSVDGDVLSISPIPLAGATTFVLRHRLIPNRSYEGDTDLGVELACARWQERRIQVRSAGVSEDGF